MKIFLIAAFATLICNGNDEELASPSVLPDRVIANEWTDSGLWQVFKIVPKETVTRHVCIALEHWTKNESGRVIYHSVGREGSDVMTEADLTGIGRSEFVSVHLADGRVIHLQDVDHDGTFKVTSPIHK